MDNLFLNEVKEQIKSRVSMETFCNAYGIPINRSGFIKCPFHDDHKASCKIYPRARGYYCFVCHSGGDVINFAEKYLNLSNTDAMRTLSPFAGVNFDAKATLSVSAEQNAIKRKREQELRDFEKSVAQQEYNLWLDKLVELDKLKTKYAPKDENEPISDIYAKAVKNYSYVVFRLEQATDKLKKFD